MIGLLTLPQQLQSRVRSVLKPGKSIIWVGQPNPDRATRTGYLLWFFFVPWTAFSLFWIAAASNFQVPDFESGWSLFPLFGLPFVLIGLGGMCSPSLMRKRALSTVYVITNNRAISIQGAKSIKVSSYPASELKNIDRTEHEDGSGDLIFKTEYYRDSDGDQQSRHYGFFSIDNVRSVENIIHNLSTTSIN